MRIEVREADKKIDETINQNIIKKRVVAYARVSTEKDEQFTSYENQISYYTDYIKSNPNYELIKIYTDEGISATSLKGRTGFQNMLKDGLKGRYDLIITKSISRFARNTVDSLMAIRKLKEKGIEVYFEKENIWTLDSKGELLITIMSSIAQEESRSISMNVTWGIRESMKKGQAYVPYKVFLGYKKGKVGEMVIDEEQAKIVRKIFGLSIQNRSAYQIAKIMEEDHVPFSPGVYKWYTSTIKSILRNEKYKGDAIRQKTYTKDYLTKEKAKNNGDVPQYYIHNHHPAIIPPAIFDRLQEDINNRPPNVDKRSRSYVFSKRIICPYCGAYYGQVIWNKGTPKEVVVWRCNNKFKADHPCYSPTVKESYIKELFIKEINDLIDKEQILRTLQKILKQIVPRISIKRKSGGPLINSFDDDLWYILLDKVVAYSKSKIIFSFNKIQ